MHLGAHLVSHASLPLGLEIQFLAAPSQVINKK